jgi:diacylglycerol kinase (ATP)
VERPLVIVNPRAGSRRGDRGRPDLVGALEAALGPVDVAVTGWRGHGVDLARRAVTEGRGLIVAVGGDGTLSEVANGVMAAGDAGEGGDASRGPAGPAATQIGFIAAGTGADFGRSVDQPATRAAQVARLADGRTRAVDVMRAEVTGPSGERIVRYSVNIISAGPGGLVARYVHRVPHALGGRAGYYLASLAALARTPRAEVRVRTTPPAPAPAGVIGGRTGGPGTAGAERPADVAADVVERRLSTYILAICNGRVFGGGYLIAPMAEVDDGRLEVVSGGTRDKRHLVLNMPRVYRGTHLEVAGVEHFACGRIDVELVDEGLRDRFLMEIDGEELGRLPLTVEVLPRAISLRV